MDIRSIKCRIIQKLLRKQAVEESFPKSTVGAWFPSNEVNQVENALQDLLESENSPVIINSNDQIALRSIVSAKSYLENNNCGTSVWTDVDTDTSDEPSAVRDRIQDLEAELESMNKSAESWRSEARRRQRFSVLIGFLSFVLGFIASGLII
jgi:hypothetical protein